MLTRWASARKDETTNGLFGFLTPAPNAQVGLIYPKAKSVTLTKTKRLFAG
jgi:hypothetical protein